MERSFPGILLNSLEKFATDNEYFSELQFDVGEGVGCIEDFHYIGDNQPCANTG